MSAQRKALACELVALEAQLLDEQDWDAWLALYTEDAQFWVPMWKDEKTLTSDPQRELSFVWLQGRQYLEERVFRVASGRSVASNPVPRTAHLVAGSIATPDGEDGMAVKSAWSSHIYQHKEARLITYAGRYEHALAWTGEGFRIRRKKIILANDQLVSKVDFFYL
ncbi:MAG: aromatic-ring-hydroxylating dioxygenase subunit beta [Haliea sp.]|nr:MAG: aromatic-ring-hydroxylating dioxygenase subunit beta [Haliea sp.]